MRLMRMSKASWYAWFSVSGMNALGTKDCGTVPTFGTGFLFLGLGKKLLKLSTVPPSSVAIVSHTIGYTGRIRS